VHAEPPKRNLLGLLLVGALVAVYFDSRFYFFERPLPAFGVSIVLSLAIFVALFFLRSRYAWHAAAIIFLAVLPVVLLLTYQGGYMGFRFTPFLAVVDLLLYALFAIVRKPYFRYIAAK
jgi:hypothetical protein